jgi:SNF2 family DNA or RNA helicase
MSFMNTVTAATTPQISIAYDSEVQKLFPAAPLVNNKILLPHDVMTTKVLSNIGYDVPSSLAHYKWPSQRQPFEVQVQTVEMLIHHPRAYVLSSMGVGKTSCPIWAFDLLKKQGYANKMIVIAPLSTLSFVWLREIFYSAPHLKAVVLHGSREKRRELLKTDADIYIINHDGIPTVVDLLVKRTDIDVMVLDELAVYRNNSKRTRQMIYLAQHKSTVWGMTGAPTPNAPTDVFYQAKIITPDRVPKYFGRFRDELMLKVSPFKWVAKKDATQKAFDALQPSVRFVLEDVTELPPYVSRRIDIAMGKKQAHVYEEMRKHAFSLVGQHKITAANAGAVLSKLLQISSGWVYSKAKGIVGLDNDGRVTTVVDLVEASDSKLIVFAAFKSALDGLSKALAAAGHDNIIVSGDTPAHERDRIFHAFQNTLQYKVLVAHPQCLAHGITLTRANTVVWFTPITSLEIYDQANARIRRVGQETKQQFIHLQSSKTEDKIYGLLINKGDIQSQLLTMFES